MSLFAALLNLFGLGLFFSQFVSGVVHSAVFLREMFKFKLEDLAFLHDYRTHYGILASISACIILMSVLTDYLHNDAQNSQHPLCPICEGIVPVFVVILHRVNPYRRTRVNTRTLSALY